MSTRQERREWQEFREHHGTTVKEFKQKWQAMFGRMPSAKELADYKAKTTELRRNLGRRSAAAQQPPVTVTRRYEWDMAHRLPNHEGKCRRLHGHRYVAEIDITGDLHTEGSSEGMVLDFGHLDTLIKDKIGHWDHRTMLHVEDPLMEHLCQGIMEDPHADGMLGEYGVFQVPYIPTAENLCREILRLLTLDTGVTVSRVRVYETPKGWAEVRQ